MGTQSSAQERTRTMLREPKKYHVIMLNDDFTTMEFVVEVLISIFQKDQATAEKLMMTVHKNGRAIVGTYPYDIAATKVHAALTRAREAGFPFRVIMEEQ